MGRGRRKGSKGRFMDGSTLLAHALKDQGAECIFTVVGGPVIEAVGACGDLGLRPIGAHHEQAAVMMAMAYEYVGGNLGVALLASGPAVTNAVTGAHVAWDNCWPVVILGGSSSRRQRGRMPFQEADSVALMRPVTKWALQADSAERIPELLAIAIRTAHAGRPGPVYLDLPADVLQATVDEAAVLRPPMVEPAARPAGEIGRASCRGKSVDLGGRRIIKKKKKGKTSKEIGRGSKNKKETNKKAQK